MVDDDEGFYALAGRAVVEGKTPYFDFFFPQMPLTAVVYGVTRKLAGPGLVPLRALGAVLAVGTTLLVHHAARRLAGRRAALLAAGLFVAHTLAWEWSVVVKTYPLALLFATAALVAATARSPSTRTELASGLLAGLAVASRLLSAPVLVGVLLPLLSRRPRTRSIVAMTGGVALALAPVVWLALRDFGTFGFDVLLFHGIRSPGDGLVKDPLQKLDVVRQLFLSPLGTHRPDVTGIQTLALVFTSIFGVRALVRSVRFETARALAPWFAAGLALLLAGLAASPTWVQYGVAGVPCLAVVAGVVVSELARHPAQAVIPVVSYAALAVASFRDRIVEADADLRPDVVDSVGRALDDATPPGLDVGAHFPPYLVASTRGIVPAAENQYARLFSDRVPASRRARLHLFDEAELRAELLSPRTGGFVVGAFVVPETALAVKDAGFVRARDLPGATVWVRPARTP